MTIQGLSTYVIMSTFVITSIFGVFIYVSSNLEFLTFLSLTYNLVNTLQLGLSTITFLGIILLVRSFIKHKSIDAVRDALAKKQDIEAEKRRKELLETLDDIRKGQESLEINMTKQYRKLDTKIQNYVINSSSLKEKLDYIINRSVPYDNNISRNAAFKGVMRNIVLSIDSHLTNFRRSEKRFITRQDREDIIKNVQDLFIDSDILTDKIDGLAQLMDTLLIDFNEERKSNENKEVKKDSISIIVDKFEVFIESAYSDLITGSTNTGSKEKIIRNLHKLDLVLDELDKLNIPKYEYKAYNLLRANILDIINETFKGTLEDRIVYENKVRARLLNFLDKI